MIGVVVVRDGQCAPGAEDVAAAARETWLIGDGLDRVEAFPLGVTRAVELGPFHPKSWCEWLSTAVPEQSLVLSAEPHGRDLAGRLGERFAVPVFAGCVELSARRAVMPRYGGATTVVVDLPQRFVATMQPRPHAALSPGGDLPLVEFATPHDDRGVRLVPPDLATVDLSDASRIVAGGAGLPREEEFALLGEVATRIGAALGATRVITDRGWLPPRHQIGTTGVAVSPELYVAFGISGAVQHTAGLGNPSHVISVNVDDACPMSLLADVAVVSDAAATLRALNELAKTNS